VPVQYTSRTGRTYYLRVGKTKTGKPKYYFAMKANDAPLAEIVPRGFEIYETPDGQVFLRKILPKLISDDELAMVEQELRRIAHLRGSRVERKLKVLTIYVADRKEDLIKELRQVLPWGPLADMDQAPEDLWSYLAELQFVLVDDKRRLFQARRYCYRGRIDDWVDIGEHGLLSILAAQYIKHLGQESYFELV
jgi:hypothetical protein